MRITIIALGSRGDVQPYIALGKGLKEAGYEVRLFTHTNFERLVTVYGLEFWPARGNVQEVAESQEMKELLERGNYLAIAAFQAKAAKRAALEWAEDGLQACRGSSLIVAGIGGLFIGLSFAELLQIPLVQAHYVPFTPTSEFLGALFPPLSRPFGGALNRLSHHLTRQIMWQASRSADTLARRKVLGLPPAPLSGPFNSRYVKDTPVLYGYSSAVIPRPRDWHANIHVTGYWFLDSDDDWRPPADLLDFLESGPPPVYIGFGSMSSRKPEETTDLVVRALDRTQQRAILLSGWNGLQKADLPASIFMLDSAPHAWLFPRMSAVVHHGGAGTTAAGLRAGVPSILIPFFADQPFWGGRVAELGVGPQPIPRKSLTVENLSQALQVAATDTSMRQRAADLGEKLQAEDGVANAVEIIQRLKM